MKLFHELFPGVAAGSVSDRLRKSGITIENPDDNRFSGVNIVIGPNGSGKTRFLEAVRDLYNEEPSADVLYCYFPDLSSRKFVKDANAPLPRYSLKNFLDRDGVTFENFVKVIEEQGEKFLLGLLNGDSEYEIEENNSRLNQMERLASSFLGKRFLRTRVRSETGAGKVDTLVVRKTFGGKTLKLAEALEKFSPGERILFYMALFLILKKELRGGVRRCIILDEPETHLHPEALLKFVEALQEEFPEADLWIATHSLFLVPQFHFENIVYIENSQIIRRNSKIYEKLIDGMLGKGEAAANAQRFFASRSQWQYYEYLSECFLPPRVVDTVNPNDPQVNEVKRFIRTEEKREVKKILDFGGGSGRLGRSMEAMRLPKWQDTVYHIVDSDPSLAEGGFMVFADLKDADADYDCIVMMNVLHEIDPNEWVKLFRELKQHLTADGTLLIIEVDALREGEDPNETGTGYILLSEPELELLFAAEDGFGEIPGSIDLPYAGAFYFDRDDLSIVSEKTVSAAIKGLEKRTYQEIKDIRSNKSRPVSAREYAFLLQQYINAKLFNEKQAAAPSVDPEQDLLDTPLE